jgi:hypothetical protein
MSIESAREYANGLAENLREDAPEDVGEWLEGILDYQVTYNSQRDLVSVRVLVTFGGPNAWIVFDGDHATVQAAWYSDVVEVFVPDVELSGLVFDYFQECVLVA